MIERPIEETRKLIEDVTKNIKVCQNWRLYVELVKEKHKLLELLNKMIHQQEIAYQKHQKQMKKEDLK